MNLVRHANVTPRLQATFQFEVSNFGPPGQWNWHFIWRRDERQSYSCPCA